MLEWLDMDADGSGNGARIVRTHGKRKGLAMEPNKRNRTRDQSLSRFLYCFQNTCAHDAVPAAPWANAALILLRLHSRHLDTQITAPFDRLLMEFAVRHSYISSRASGCPVLSRPTRRVARHGYLPGGQTLREHYR